MINIILLSTPLTVIMSKHTPKHIDIILSSCPKPFIGPFIDIQSNAVDSWIALNHVMSHVKVHIYLIGDEENIEKACEINKINHISNVKRNEFGTPLISDIFKITQSIDVSTVRNSEKVYCFINSDIILMPDFIHTINAFIQGRNQNSFGNFSKENYLLVGQRTDIERVPRLFNFNDLEKTYKDLSVLIQKKGILHSPDGMDYFIFSKGTFPFVYDFAIGKLVWDAWLTGNAFRRGLMTIDTSNTITAIHQNGDWYQASKKDTSGLIKTRDELEKTKEVLINQSFDYYEKNSKSGTVWKTEIDKHRNAFLFVKKELIPDND